MNNSEFKELAVTRVRVNEKIKKHVTHGMGWNSENYWDKCNKISGEEDLWDDDAFKRYHHLVEFLSPKIVRFGISATQWSPKYGEYDFSGGYTKSNRIQLDKFKKLGTDIVFAIWCAFGDSPENFWWTDDFQTGRDPKNHASPPYNREEWIEAIVVGLDFYVNKCGYDNIKWISLWNEPGNANFNSPGKTYPEYFWPMYEMLKAEMKKYGLDEKVKIFGPDVTWVLNFGEMIKKNIMPPKEGDSQRFGALIDSIAIHDYDTMFDYNFRRFYEPGLTDIRTQLRTYNPICEILQEYESIMDTAKYIYENEGKSIPEFFVGEIGNTCYGASYFIDKSALLDGMVLISEHIIRGFDIGVDGFMRWNLTYTEPDYDGNIMQPFYYRKESNGFSISPLSYYQAALLARFTTKGFDVLEYNLIGTDIPKRVFVTPVKCSDGNYTIFIVNDDFVSKHLELDLSALGEMKLHEYSIGSYEQSGISCGNIHGEKANIALNPRSLYVLSTNGDIFRKNSLLTLNQDDGSIIYKEIFTENKLKKGQYTLRMHNGASIMESQLSVKSDTAIDSEIYTIIPLRHSLLLNGSFEDGEKFWNMPEGGRVEFKGTTPHSGWNYATLDASLNGGSYISQTLTGLEPGHYAFSGYTRVIGASTARLRVSVCGVEDVSTEINAGFFARNYVEFVVPENTDTVTVYFETDYTGENAVADGDDFEVRAI